MPTIVSKRRPAGLHRDGRSCQVYVCHRGHFKALCRCRLVQHEFYLIKTVGAAFCTTERKNSAVLPGARFCPFSFRNFKYFPQYGAFESAKLKKIQK